jgi:hypothetical protein
VSVVMAAARLASAQVTPAAGYTPPDDTPSIRVGVTLYPAYTLQTEPNITDAGGNSVEKSTFDVLRAYINVTGQLSHIVAFRITPDITRQSGLLSLAPGSTVSSDSLIYRIKYAYGQFNLDDWVGKGSWVRLGIQQTPWVDFDEGIYRYRFQGTTFAERQSLPTTFTSADAGVSFHYMSPKNILEVHLGEYNGENYQKVETNNEKGFEMRASVRPFPGGSTLLRGLRGHFVYYNDNYVKDAERTRMMGNLTWEHPYLVFGFESLTAHDQALVTAPDVHAGGYSFWGTPRKPLANGASVEALLRYDHFMPNESSSPAPLATSTPGTLFSDQQQNRKIIGGSYWFPHQGNVSAAIMLDYDAQMFKNITTAPQKVWALHGLIQF